MIIILSGFTHHTYKFVSLYLSYNFKYKTSAHKKSHE